jgi:hypothetical protein
MENPKKQLRPEILSIIKTENFSPLEKFQNETLRPIIKLQHELILTRFEHYLKQNKINIIELNKTQKPDLMNKLFKSDTRLKNDFRGLIIGLFTLEEYKEYLTISSQLNKRINNMIRQKIDNS